MRRNPLLALPMAAGLVTLIAVPALSGRASGTTATATATPLPLPRALISQTPSVVLRGSAALRGIHNPASRLTLNIGLDVRDSAALDARIAAASSPGNPSYGHYLTQAEYMNDYAPTSGDVAAVHAWATGAGLTVRSVSPDRLIVRVEGTTSRVERALAVRINDYRLHGRAFMSNDRDATVPGDLPIRAISGLSTLHRFHSTIGPLARLAGSARPCGCYYPSDFRMLYGVDPLGDGTGQTIGLTLWGAPVSQGDLDSFAANTGTARLISGVSGPDGIDWIPVNGNDGSFTGALDETALDAEYAHAVAPHSHLKFWLSDVSCDPSTPSQCGGSDTGLETALDDAANDPSVQVVSNSWGGDEPTSAADPFVAITNATLQHAAAVGKTFYFSTGDDGYYSGGTVGNCDPTSASCAGLPSYPADSPYVVAVGGTSLNVNPDGSYAGETAWNGGGRGASGGGCSTFFARPSWQVGVGAATCAGRAVPDVSADGDPSTGAYVILNGAFYRIAGTSLAAPLWGAMTVIFNRYLGERGMPPVGFIAPHLYALAANPVTYARDFHDVTSGYDDPQGGTRGYAAGPGWDEASGWGSPNLANIAADWTGSPVVASTPLATQPPAPTSTGTVPLPSSTPMPVNPSPTSTASPVTATVTVTATATRQAQPSPVAKRTPTPRPVPKIMLVAGVGVPHGLVTGNDSIPVSVRTSPNARATITLQLSRVVPAYVGTGKKRKKVLRTTVLYRAVIHARTDRRGWARARMRLSYAPRVPLRATLTVMAQVSRTRFSRNVYVIVLPPHRAAGGKQKSVASSQ